MKYLSIILIIIALAFSCSSKSQVPNVKLETFEDSVAYAIGMNLGQNFKRDSIMLDTDIIAAGIHDMLYSDTTKLNETQLQEIFQAFNQQLQAKQAQKSNMKLMQNKAAGEKFLAENAKKEGVVTTASGLQYKVIKEGTGPKPGPTTKVKVHYTGKILDGTVFDSSVERGTPAEFGLNQVIKGWTEGLQLMSPGAEYILYIPSDLAYGDQQRNELITPGSTLIFEVQLIDILD